MTFILLMNSWNRAADLLRPAFHAELVNIVENRA